MESRDPHAGLFGAIIVTAADMANEDATPKDVDRCVGCLGGAFMQCVEGHVQSRLLIPGAIGWSLSDEHQASRPLTSPANSLPFPQRVCALIFYPG